MPLILLVAVLSSGGTLLLTGGLNSINTTGRIVLAGGALYLGARLAKVI